MKLYSYFRSSAAYRVRIALGLKNLQWDTVPVRLGADEQRGAEFLKLNPQGLVPALALDDASVISQSTAIVEWLEETHAQPPLYPRAARDRAAIRALCQHIACDIHPLNNLRVLGYLKEECALAQDAVERWYAHWIQRGFSAVETALEDFPGPFSLGDRPGMLEVYLTPQVHNARRFKVALHAFPKLQALDERCRDIDAFVAAHPQRQPDTPESLRA